jgi:hypothetical protein
MTVERFGPERIRQIRLELGGSAGKNGESFCGRAGLQMGEQPGLADTGLALDRDDLAPPGAERIQRSGDRLALRGAADEGRERRRHSAILA